MHFTSETRLDGIVERTVDLAGIPGILWTPASASPAAPVPLLLAGPPPLPGGLERIHPRLLGRAQQAAEAGFASATLELPGCGGRPAPAGQEEALAEMRRAIAAGEPVTDDVVTRTVIPLVDQAVPEWRSLVDALLELPEIGGPVGYSGGLLAIGIRLAAVDPRIAAAVLFAGSYVPSSIVDEARTLRIPLHVLLQWDDEGNVRSQALDLFDAFGSREKTLTANMGGHTGVPHHAGEAATQFFVRHLTAR